MLSFEDCLRVSPLSEAEIDAIAQHENLPEMVALELGNYLVHTADGRRRIKSMILDDIAAAETDGNTGRALLLKATLQHFIDTHPENPGKT